MEQVKAIAEGLSKTALNAQRKVINEAVDRKKVTYRSALTELKEGVAKDEDGNGVNLDNDLANYIKQSFVDLLKKAETFKGLMTEKQLESAAKRSEKFGSFWNSKLLNSLIVKHLAAKAAIKELTPEQALRNFDEAKKKMELYASIVAKKNMEAAKEQPPVNNESTQNNEGTVL